MTRSKVKVKVTRPVKLEILRFSKYISSPIFNVSWQMTTDSETMEQYLTFVQSRFLISVLVIGITADKNHIIFALPATCLTYSVHCCHCDFAKKPDLLQKNPETQTRPKKPRFSGGKPAITIPFARWRGVLRS